MAIDLLTRGATCPIFVGDAEAIGKYQRVANSGGSDDLEVFLIDSAGVGKAYTISRSAKDSMMRNELAVLVSLTPDDEIASAFLCAIDDADTEKQPLGQAELKALAERLVARDFNLDYLE